MRVSDILQRCSHLKVESKNDISEDFVERVIFKDECEEWKKILAELLGPAVKQAGVKTTKELHELTINYGGVLDNQVLYYKKYEDHSVIAMIWPWHDNNQATLKIARFKE